LLSMANLTPAQRLLPPNRSPLELALAGASPIDLDTDGLRHLWTAMLCLAPVLPWLSWTLSVEAWHEAKSDGAKRALILSSIEIHRHKGTPWSIRLLIRALGFGEVDIIERVGGRTHNGTIRRDGVFRMRRWRPRGRPTWLPSNAPSPMHRPSACASSCRPSHPRAATWWRCGMPRSRTATTA
jgi:phage tail P2-like protein